jgi:adenylate cyclase
MDNETHTEDAVRTALQMMESLDEFNAEILLEGIPPFRLGLGVHTATVVVGNMGSDQRFDYTCIGDGVNTAARMEGQTKNYGVDILLGPKTADTVKDDYIILEMDNIAVKGKTEGVQIYTIIEKQTAETVAARGHHELMFAKYRDQDFEACITICNSLKVEFSGKLKGFYEMWIDRCEGLMQQNLPSDWDGIFRATSK